MESKKPTMARRKFYINKAFQANFILKFCCILLLGCILSIGLTFLTTADTLTSNFVNSRLSIQSTSHAIMPSVVLTNLITTAIIIAIAVIVTLLVSHKIAGPMFRFEKDIERVAAGDLKSRFRIRNGDQFTEVVDSLNTMVLSLNSSLAEIKEGVDTAIQKAEDENVSEEMIAELIQDMKKVQQNIETSFIIE